MRLDELLLRAGYQAHGQDIPPIEVQGLGMDSRTIAPGDLYIGRLDFANDALRAGACAAVQCNGARSETPLLISVRSDTLSDEALAWKVAAAFYRVHPLPVRLWGVTGTNGKSTVAHLVQELLLQCNRRTGLIGTLEYRLGKTVVPATHTTPSPVQLGALFAEMAESGITDCAIEISSHALDQARITPDEVSTAIFTNLTRDHLDYHGSMDNYFAAKQKLFTHLPPHATAIINADDAYGIKIVEATNAEKVFTYAIDTPATLQAQRICCTLNGSRFDAHYQGEVYPVQLSLCGRHNIVNALAAALAVIEAGYDVKQVLGFLGRLRGAVGRMEMVASYNGATIIVDYAHSPDALEHVLQSVRPLTQKKMSILFGCGGDRDRGKRPLMGEIASRYADKVYLTSDNPRTENPASIINEIRAGIVRGTALEISLDRRASIAKALGNLNPGDVLIVAGKGHETYQTIGVTDTPFHDPTVIRECITQREHRN